MLLTRILALLYFHFISFFLLKRIRETKLTIFGFASMDSHPFWNVFCKFWHVYSGTLCCFWFGLIPFNTIDYIVSNTVGVTTAIVCVSKHKVLSNKKFWKEKEKLLKSFEAVKHLNNNVKRGRNESNNFVVTFFFKWVFILIMHVKRMPTSQSTLINAVNDIFMKLSYKIALIVIC